MVWSSACAAPISRPIPLKPERLGSKPLRIIERKKDYKQSRSQVDRGLTVFEGDNSFIRRENYERFVFTAI